MTYAPATVLVLVAEDDTDLRELIAMSVEGAGLRTVCATDGITAARILETATPRAIITDVGMPAMTGLELCRLVRSQQRHRDLPVIMVSAAIDDADIEAGYAAGATDYLVKPFSPRRFRARLAELLNHDAPIRRRVPHHARPHRFATPAGPRNMPARW
ncbi:DNA-binding response OmpR family regulator [Catenuloplanes nepalensis]|uniref:DNA-binding response OmpR family regulator n=1 Tax=Catenuloplanes nepalensis TaxID=587533 RepID=A0ABT9MZA9_9ACTN|nr:response regulator [Catenuloplanes nepalensis]MDP9796772.1 DNA-binding response OmpR family regulator [Catenuloplanes nepalensis]